MPPQRIEHIGSNSGGGIMCCGSCFTCCSDGSCGFCSECVNTAACNPNLCGSCISGDCADFTCNGQCCATAGTGPNICCGCVADTANAACQCTACSPSHCGSTDQAACDCKCCDCKCCACNKTGKSSKGSGGGSGSAGSSKGGGQSAPRAQGQCKNLSTLSNTIAKMGTAITALMSGGKKIPAKTILPGQQIPSTGVTTITSNTFLLIIVIVAALLFMMTFGKGEA